MRKESIIIIIIITINIIVVRQHRERGVREAPRSREDVARRDVQFQSNSWTEQTCFLCALFMKRDGEELTGELGRGQALLRQCGPALPQGPHN